MKDLGWILLHVAGAVAGHVWGLWVPYWATFAFVELVGLVARFPFTWTVHGFLDDGSGFAASWRLTLVGAWSVWLVATFLLFAPLPAWVKGPIAVGFGVWLWPHFFGHRTPRTTPDSPTPDSPPRWGPGGSTDSPERRPRGTDDESGPTLR